MKPEKTKFSKSHERQHAQLRTPKHKGCETMEVSLCNVGFATFQKEDLNIHDGLSAAYYELIESAKKLPPDADSPESGRSRRHITAVFDRETECLSFMPSVIKDGMNVSPYYQASNYNPDRGNVVRYFPALTKQQQDNPVIEHLVKHFYQGIPRRLFDQCRFLEVGIHFLRYNAQPGCVTAASPNCLHRDGEPVTAIVLLDREGVDGGENFVAPAKYAGQKPEDMDQKDFLAYTNLLNPFDGVIVDDKVVSHHVNPVTASGSGIGHRTVLLIDFSELIVNRS